MTFLPQSISLLSKVKRYSLQLEWQIRCFFLNKDYRIHVSKHIHCDRTAKLQLKPGGIDYGGKICVSDNTSIMEGVIIAPYGGTINISENVFLGPYCVLYGHGGLSIGRDTMIAAHSVVIPSNHGFAARNKPICSQKPISLGITIGEDVWIGCGVRILDGVSIGKGCVIGAGAVVTKSMPEYSIAVGVPAKVIGSRGDSFENSTELSSVVKSERVGVVT